MSARSKARKRAVDVLYAAEVRGVPILERLEEEEQRAGENPARASSWEYARTLVEGVGSRLDELDIVITAHAEGWTLERMPAVDRALARIGAWEVLHNPDVPDAVAIAEAVELASTLSTDGSPRFLNGLLNAVARGKTETPVEPRTDTGVEP